MPNIGPLEIGIVLLIALIVFGPKRLPGLGRSLGEGIHQFRSSVTSFHDSGDPAPTGPPQVSAGLPAPPADTAPASEASQRDQGPSV